MSLLPLPGRPRRWRAHGWEPTSPTSQSRMLSHSKGSRSAMLETADTGLGGSRHEVTGAQEELAEGDSHYPNLNDLSTRQEHCCEL